MRSPKGNFFLVAQVVVLNQGLEEAHIIQMQHLLKEFLGLVKEMMETQAKAFLLNTVSPKEYQLVTQPPVFISYAWELNGIKLKHLQVLLSQFANDLKTAGIVPWLDLPCMSGGIQEQMSIGINESEYVLFIGTQCYAEKTRPESETNVNKELKFALEAKKKPDSFLPLLLEGKGENGTEDYNMIFPRLQNELIRDCRSWFDLQKGKWQSFKNYINYINALTQYEPVGILPCLLGLNRHSDYPIYREKCLTSYKQLQQLFIFKLEKLNSQYQRKSQLHPCAPLDQKNVSLNKVKNDLKSGAAEQLAVKPVQNTPIMSGAAQKEQPFNIQGEQLMSKDDKSNKLVEMLDFKPFSKTKSGLVIGFCTALSGFGGWFVGSTTATLITSLTPIAEAAVTAASVAGANFHTVLAAAELAASGTSVSVLGSMSGVAMMGANSAAIVTAGLQSSSMMSTILLSLGITTGTIGMVVGGGVALLTVGGLVYCFYQSEQSKMKLIDERNIAVQASLAALKAAGEAKTEAGEAKTEAKKAMDKIQTNDEAYRIESKSMEERVEESMNKKMEILQKEMERRMMEGGMRTGSPVKSSLITKTSSNEPISKNPLTLLSAPRNQSNPMVESGLEAKKNIGKENVSKEELYTLTKSV